MASLESRAQSKVAQLDVTLEWGNGGMGMRHLEFGEWEWDGGGYLGVEEEVVRFDVSVDEVECVD